MAEVPGEVVHYSPRPGETFCHIAVDHGFADCEKVRAANSHRDFKDLPFLTGDEDDLLIPPIEEGVDTEPDQTDTEYKLENYPPPSISFIRERGAGYPDDPLGRDDRKFDPHYPTKDETITKLNITNYHVNWAGKGTQPEHDDFAAATLYDYHEPSSRDPDHFKVQVYDNKVPEGTNEVTVKLYAMRPIYEGSAEGKEYIEFTGSHELPASDDRKLELTCQRVGETNYFRSPYLRLVTTESDRTARPTQALLMKDYYADGKDDEEKRFSEILDQVVRAVYYVQMCKLTDDTKRCQVVEEATLTLDREVPLAIHILQGSTATHDKVREQVHKWMRRCLAQANVRPHLKVLHTVPVPKNMLSVSDRDGVHASGKDGGGNQSKMKIRIGGTEHEHQPTRGHSPLGTAQRLKTLLEGEGMEVRGPFKLHVENLRAKRGEVSSPYDLLVFDENGDPVEIQAASSTDRPAANGKLGQSLLATNGTDVDQFHAQTPEKDAHRDLRSFNHNHRTDDCFNFFVCGANLLDETGGGLWGIGPTGNYDGWTWLNDVGPCAIFRGPALDAAEKPFNPTHELFHPLMHVGHTTDAPQEIMHGQTSTADELNGSKHVGDAPIEVVYTVFYKKSRAFNHVMDGKKHEIPVLGFLALSTKKFKDTPVQRFRRVGASYGLVVRPTDRRADGP